jgi:epoxyqueuosine reductase
MGTARLTQDILELAGRHDFDLAAVAPVERLPAALRLEEWLSRGMHGTMEWMARNAERRADPARLLPGARSVLIVAMSYWTDDEPAHDGNRGCISRYAWGDEYHQVLGERLEALWGAIRELIPGVEGRWYVDTGPVLEKAWAERAGVGWIGKHTNLISQRLGSWIFLGAVVMDAELAPGEPHVDRCGTCRACIDVCPTDAIVAPYVLDARRCISYLTIENRGPIPVEYRRDIGNRIFGCDDCQDVCPWNRFAKASARAADFAPRSENRAPELIELLALDEPAFRARFAGSPVLRAKRRGFVRNVAVALGNSGDRDSVGPLTTALDDDDALVRGHAAWALGELGGPAATTALHDRERRETDPWVAAEISAALDVVASNA